MSLGRLVVSVVLLSGCSSRLPTPPAALHVGEDFLIVPYPPPVARVERVPPQPYRDTVWIDGGWEWSGRDYAWRDGRWVLPPEPGARYAPATTIRSPNGPLYFHPGQWYRDDGSRLATPGDGT